MKGREGRRRGRRGGRRNSEPSPAQHRPEKQHCSAWSWENIPGRALLLGSGGRPKAARKGWEESPRLLPAPQEEPAGLAPGALGPWRGGFVSTTQDTSSLTVRVGVYSVGFWGAPLAPRLSGNFCQIKPVCLPQHVKKKRHLFLDFKKITCYPWQALMFK